jgi:hypothetical protein
MDGSGPTKPVSCAFTADDLVKSAPNKSNSLTTKNTFLPIGDEELPLSDETV